MCMNFLETLQVKIAGGAAMLPTACRLLLIRVFQCFLAGSASSELNAEVAVKKEHIFQLNS